MATYEICFKMTQGPGWALLFWVGDGGPHTQIWMNPMHPSLLGASPARSPSQPPGYVTLAGGWEGERDGQVFKHWMNPMHPSFEAGASTFPDRHPRLDLGSIAPVPSVEKRPKTAGTGADYPTSACVYRSRSSSVAGNRDDSCGLEPRGAPNCSYFENNLFPIIQIVLAMRGRHIPGVRTSMEPPQ